MKKFYSVLMCVVFLFMSVNLVSAGFEKKTEADVDVFLSDYLESFYTNNTDYLLKNSCTVKIGKFLTYASDQYKIYLLNEIQKNFDCSYVEGREIFKNNLIIEIFMEIKDILYQSSSWLIVDVEGYNNICIVKNGEKTVIQENLDLKGKYHLFINDDGNIKLCSPNKREVFDIKTVV